MTKTFVTGEVLTAADTNTFLVNNGFQFVGTRFYTSSGTFAKADPFGDSSFDGAKMRAIRVRMVGGGGSGGGAAATGSNQVSIGSGGGGATFSESFIVDIAGLPSTVTVTRGAGGAAATAANGNAGGQSSFDSIVTAPGGREGSFRGATTPPTNITANVQSSIGVGQFSTSGSSGTEGSGVGGAFSIGGTGGGSLLGGGSRGAPSPSDTSTGFGGGSGGAARSQNIGATASSGAGGNGIVIVDVFA